MLQILLDAESASSVDFLDTYFKCLFLRIKNSIEEKVSWTMDDCLVTSACFLQSWLKKCWLAYSTPGHSPDPPHPCPEI